MKSKAIFPSGDVGFEGNEPRRPGIDTFEEVVQRRISRRSALGAAFAPLFTAAGIAGAERANAQNRSDGLLFTPVEGNGRDQITVPEGYEWAPLAKWGDPLRRNGPAFDPDNQTPEAQERQFGYNCDFVAWFDMPFGGGGVVGVNHEYTNPELMFRNYSPETTDANEVGVEIRAHGASFFQVFPVRVRGGAFRWERAEDSRFNFRVHGESPLMITGPLAGHPLLQTSYDASGRMVRGMFNNCGGGTTPWGTYLTCEENVDQYFGNNDAVPNEAVRAANARFGVRGEGSARPWHRFESRFDLSVEPNEMNRMGYVVEINPFDPDWTPRKRTALGKFKHEGAASTLSRDNRAVVYSGDDARFEYVYKFVSERSFDRRDIAGARESLLDSGTLYAARFNDDGTGEWLPLVFGENGLTPANGFNSQAEVLFFARQAADVLGATQMDRPEDICVNPQTGKAYVALTNNTRRTEEQLDAANPRASNAWGHIIEIEEAGGDNGATEFRWEIFMLCGDPSDASQGTFFAGFDQSLVSKIANPDNLAFDRRGNLVIATDGQSGSLDINDGIFFCPTEGPNRGWNRQIFSGVRGAECASVILNSANNLMLVTVQHPGEGGTREEKISQFPNDGTEINRPSVVGVWRTRAPFSVGS